MSYGDHGNIRRDALGPCFGLFDAMPSVAHAEGSVLFKQGAASREVFLLEQGLVKVIFLDPAGEEVITHLCSQPGSVIGEGSMIENSVIGIRSRIGLGSTIVSSYIMGGDYYETLEEMVRSTERGIPKIGIGERCYIKNTIIDKNCRIGNDVRINGGSHLSNTDHALYTVKDGIVVVKKGSILPDGFVI